MVTAVRSRDVDRPVLVLVPDLQGVECPQEGVAVGRIRCMCSYTIFIAARRSLPFSWPPSAACGWVMKSLITGRPSIRIVIADCSISNGPLQLAADRGHAAGYRVGGLHRHAGHSPGGTRYPGGDAGPGGTGLPSRLCG